MSAKVEYSFHIKKKRSRKKKHIMSSTTTTAMTETQWETYQITLAIVFSIAFLLLIWTLMKCSQSQHYHVLPWWGHIIMFLFVFPISMLTSAAELYQQYYPPSEDHHRVGRSRSDPSDSDSDGEKEPESEPVQSPQKNQKDKKKTKRTRR
jgi:hypothetical protein